MTYAQIIDFRLEFCSNHYEGKLSAFLPPFHLSKKVPHEESNLTLLNFHDLIIYSDASSEDTDMLDNMYFEEEDWGVSLVIIFNP